MSTIDQRITDPDFLRQLKIVSVDDNEFARKVMWGALCVIGIRNIVEFEKPVEALDYILKSPPDIIITDNMMPKLSGIELTQIIRSQPKAIFKNVPIIMATAYSDDVRIKDAKDVGFVSILSKPFSPDDLRSKIHRELKHFLVGRE